MLWIGLTGGIAAGKSTATGLIKSLGLPVVDADLISRDLTKINKEGYRQIINFFGTEILDDKLNLNRKKLAEIVFNDTSQKEALEKILHPLIRKEVENQRNELISNGNKLAFYDVPLLFEKNMETQFDKVVLIWVSPRVQITRLMSRDDISEASAKHKIQQQIDINQKVPLANYCIDNSTTLFDLELQIKHLIARLRS